MKSDVKDFEFFDQSYVEELIRQMLPSVKINNVVPWQVLTDAALGNNALVSQPGLLYYGFIQGGHSSHAVYHPDGIFSTTISNTAMPYPFLFKGVKEGAINYNNIRFIGWKITIENASTQGSQPKPPSTPPLVDGFDFFLFDEQDLNPLDKYNCMFAWGKINDIVKIVITSVKEPYNSITIAKGVDGAGYLQVDFAYDISEGVRVQVIRSATGAVFIDRVIQLNTYPFSFVAAKVGADLVLTFSATATNGTYGFSTITPQVYMYNQADYEPVPGAISTGAAMVKTFASIDYAGAVTIMYQYQTKVQFTLFDTSVVNLEMGHVFLVKNQIPL
ncbi:MAG: hypothetical protein ACTHMM_13405 [Agriterribacter sp.]